VPGDDLRDAGTHGPAPDHADRFDRADDLFCHVVPPEIRVVAA
jgi:hypothetical protein